MALNYSITFLGVLQLSLILQASNLEQTKNRQFYYLRIIFLIVCFSPFFGKLLPSQYCHPTSCKPNHYKNSHSVVYFESIVATMWQEVKLQCLFV